MEFEFICGMSEGPRRTARLAAWVQGLYPDAAPVLVGGAAVELYSGGAYVTGDLDFVGEVPNPVAARLRSAGFRKEGRHWIHERAQIFLEFPSSVLAPGFEPATLEVGPVSVLTVRPEDLVLDRLRSFVFWKHREDGMNAFRLIRAQRSVIDRKRLVRGAVEEEVRAALLPLLRLMPTKGRGPSPAQVRRWMDEVVP
jgi:hypothetical protein